MSERNKRDNSSDNKNDLFVSFNKGNNDIDELLEDAFSFMDTSKEEGSEDNFNRASSKSFYVEHPKTDDELAARKSNKTHRTSSRKGEIYDSVKAHEKGKKKVKKVIYSILIAILSICIVLVSGGLIYFYKTAKDIYYEGDALPTQPGYTLSPEENFDTMYGVTNTSSLNAYLRSWANNGGEIMRSDNVINILLIGQDGDGGENSNGRADSLIIASINKATKTITLSSVMRDSYIYMNFDGKEKFDKINTACVYGGQKGVVETIEKNYKIDIDYFVSVYFESFVDVVDALGGVNVPVSSKLAGYINRTSRYNIASGDSVRLSGAEALVYSRVRYAFADGDVSRTGNQRNVIMGIINKMKGASFQQVYNAINAILPYIKTNMKEDAIISYAKQALSEGWVNYTIKQGTFPTEDTRASATINGMSCWVVDYQRAAQYMQKAIYGRTNIAISSNDVNPIRQFLYLYQQPSQNTETTGSYVTNEAGEIVTEEGYTGEIVTGEGYTGENQGTTENTTSPPLVEPTLPPVEVTDFADNPTETEE